MAHMIDTKESRIAQDFLKGSKKAFSEKIPKNTVKDIDITECTQDESYAEAVRIKMIGSVETSSPTGKPRTYLYHATVDVAGKKASFASLEIEPIEG